MKVQERARGVKGLNGAIAVSAILAIGGLALWIYQLSRGLIVSNMTNMSSWGFYITNFMFFVGLSAGGLIISSAPRLFGLKGFGGISKAAIWTSIVCTVLAISCVVVDLGGPARIWELVVFANPTSPLVWDVFILTTYLILSIFYLRANIRFEQGRTTARSLRVMSGFALVVAILVHSVTAWIFGLLPSHELWNTALLAPWFVSSALVCGLALVLVVVMGLMKMGYLDIARENVVKMVRLLGVFVAIDLFFFGCDILTEGYPGSTGARVVGMLVGGPLAPFFWFEVLGGIFTLLVCFIDKLRRPSLIVIAALCTILGIFCKRVQLLVGGFQMHSLGFVGPLSGPVHGGFPLGLVYFPSAVEIGVIIGIISLGVFAVLMGVKYLPLAPGAAKSTAPVVPSSAEA